MRDSTRLPYPPRSRTAAHRLHAGDAASGGLTAYSAWNTERLPAQSRTAVFNASRRARQRSWSTASASVERLAQQIALLDDPELGADYARGAPQLQQLADEIAADCRSTHPVRRPRQHRRAGTEPLRPSHRSPRRSSPRGEITEHVDRLSDSAREVLAISNLIVDRESSACASTPSTCSAA